LREEGKGGQAKAKKTELAIVNKQRAENEQELKALSQKIGEKQKEAEALQKQAKQAEKH
jgi:hypothetical protein